MNKIILPNELENDVNYKSGKSGGWPNYFKYTINKDQNNCVTISVNSKDLNKKACRRLDPWGLAFVNYAQSRCEVKINAVDFVISGDMDKIKPYGRLDPDLESFRRRVSFLNINNTNIRFGITIDGETLGLDDANTLFNRPDNEKIHESFGKETQDNTPGRLEKDFQTWLFANDIKKEERDAHSNERLAVLGDDFFKLTKRGFGIIRECHTGSFLDKPSKITRILPTDLVDIVSLNKHGQLSVIELKLNDSQLEVIAQLMDYALFFRCYREKIWPIIVKILRHNPKSQEIVCYVVNNHFHDRFDDVVQYYIPKNESYGFSIKKVVLGYSKP